MQSSRNVLAVLAVVVFVATTAGVVGIVYSADGSSETATLVASLLAASGTLIAALVAAFRAEEAKAVGRENRDRLARHSDELAQQTEQLGTISKRVNGELDARIEAAVIAATQPLLVALAERPPATPRRAADVAARTPRRRKADAESGE